MADHQERIDQLLSKLESLLRRQETFSIEISELRKEVNELRSSQQVAPEPKKEVTTETTLQKRTEEVEDIKKATFPQPPKSQPQPQVAKVKQKPKGKSDLEKFIGENLINKIGIAITVIGVAIGAKYSIENDLISPLTRIVLGYLAGLGLLAFGMKLKKKYENYSAVLVSGAMAIMYFITFAAFSFYGLISQTFTFILMVVFTAFTVLASLNYNKQLIAHIGLVGAYAIPFLLSDGSGDVAVLFSYMAIINVGILFISFKKLWKPLYYVAFFLTWIIYFSWYLADYYRDEHFSLALIFLFTFFIIFYTTFIAYKLIKQQKFQFGDILVLLANSFIFYGIGYALLDGDETGTQLLGIFTLFNAIVHFVVSLLVYKRKVADKNLFHFILGLVLVFITIAIPVQLDGNWVTLLWIGQATLLFWIGRTKNIDIYEKLAYPLILLAFISLIHDWSSGYSTFGFLSKEHLMTPVFNVHFLTSLLFAGGLAFIIFLERHPKYPSALNSMKWLARAASYMIPGILLLVLYYSFRFEIEYYYDRLHHLTAIASNDEGYHTNSDLLQFKAVWVANYTLLFFTVLTFVNIKRFRNQLLGYINLGLNTFSILAFLTIGLFLLSELREGYLSQDLADYFNQGSFHIWIRYISFAFMAAMLYACYRYVRQDFLKANLKIGFDILLHISLLWIASSELIHWMDMAESTQSYKLGLSILWGVYSLILIAFGIWKRRKHLRIGAIILFGITLIKLFFYDIAHLNTLSKTIVFMSLGILLLVISFLYNKYKNQISDEPKK
ncbi:DUF2339 domain-containing protein [Sungkyunkwania multivorans]|uniref:DUF2339 domain-containing protein n=1 Tax=Sungkyunkwania multivorans TaxID=1173618 RepID=A0ABW3CWR2_9FLAO